MLLPSYFRGYIILFIKTVLFCCNIYQNICVLLSPYTDINECSPDPCLNGATCSDGVNGYTCACADGYRGDDCGTGKDSCKLF